MTIDYNTLQLFKPWLLGYCNCGCNQNLKRLENKQGKIIQFIQYHNINELRFYGPDHHKFTGYRSKNGQGYWRLNMPNHPSSNKRGFIYEHRYIMEQFIGRYLKAEEVIHHKNGIRDDNRIENLELISSNGEHISKYNRKDFSNRFCSQCKSYFTPMRKDCDIPIWRKDGKGGYLCRYCDRINKKEVKKRRRV